MLEKMLSQYKDGVLPGKSEYRQLEDKPFTVEEIGAEFGSWDVFTVEFNKFVAEKAEAKQAKPTPKQVTTKPADKATGNATK